MGEDDDTITIEAEVIVESVQKGRVADKIILREKGRAQDCGSTALRDAFTEGLSIRFTFNGDVDGHLLSSGEAAPVR